MKAEDNRRVTLKSIAKAAKVAVSTVSMALKNHPEIPPSTCKKIQQLANELGYCPDPALSSLAVYRTSIKPVKYQETIVYCNPSDQKWRFNATYVDYYDGAYEEARRWGYKLEEFPLGGSGVSIQRSSEILLARNIRGLIIGPMPVTKGHLSLKFDSFSAVTIGHTLARPKLHRISNNQYNSVMMAVRQIRKYGYRRIGFAIPESYNSRANHLWIAGFLVEQRRFALRDQIPVLMTKKFTESAFEEWYRAFRPEVILTLRTGILKWLELMGIRVPEDVGFVELNRGAVKRNCAGIDQNSRLVGATAINLLIGMLQRNERGIPETPKTMFVDGKWVDGATLKKKY